MWEGRGLGGGGGGAGRARGWVGGWVGGWGVVILRRTLLLQEWFGTVLTPKSHFANS